MCAVRTNRHAVILFALALALIASRAHAGEASALASKLHARRSAPSDLEISGQVPGVPVNQSRFLTRDDLIALSQPMSISPEDGNFKNAARVRAIPLEKLATALGVAANEMIVADCRDKYQAHYPRAYLAEHHPVLVSELDGAPLHQEKEDDYGPYMIAHKYFSPAFKILAHSDEPQIPWGVTGLQFRDEKTFLAPIAPKGVDAGKKSARDGFQIAEQNCLRCHYNGTTGGVKSGVGWALLSTLATQSPDFFTAYVRDPKAKNPQTRMAGSPEYDDATMAALIAYFRAFSPAGAR
jgi:cytochrome c2